MLAKWRAGVVGLALIVGVAFSWLVAAETPPQQARRDGLMKAYHAGNYKDAYDGLRQLALDPKDDRFQVGTDLDTAVHALRNLGRSDESDDFREAVIAVHKLNWRLLEAAAQSYAN